MHFRTELVLVGRNTGVLVPDEIVEALGAGRRPAVTVTIGDFSYRSTIASMGGRFLISFSAANRAATGLVGGEQIDVDLELDTAPREIEVPEDLAAALAEDPAARAFFDGLSFSNKRKHVEPILAAKAADTRARRIQKAVELFSEGRS